ncbi:MAG TPA: glucan biosynthesis protein D [Caulobacteraceae bacterium]|nr:glucan biosynthesis protein D [Caulobacteraceae bacterium]
MTAPIERRSLLAGLSGLAALFSAAEPRCALAAGPGLKLGAPFAFDFERLKAIARAAAAKPYTAPLAPAPDVLKRIDYEAWGKIAFDTDKALFKDSRFPVTFFHLGLYFQSPVQMFAVERGQAREVVYSQDDFHLPPDSPARRLPQGAGFAGLRVQEPSDGKLDWRKNDWAAFLGASYFRAIGQLYQYGLSARAIALDTAVAGKDEEFPAFTRMYIERPQPGSDTLVVSALLEGPSVTGACRFAMTRGAGVVMDVDQMLILRRPVARLGLAPLTSMYWFSETAKPTAIDWRPEVHDSDGLAMWTGWGEHLWRPLNDPPRNAASAFADDNPKGFGLLQRDRNFDHYLDGVYYDRRPSLWVEPKGAWGKGAVQLIELPTDDEIHDNIVACWVPQTQPAPGAEFDLSFRLYWLADEPFPTDLARCVATRLGRGGQPGQPRPPGQTKFMVEFLGGPLATLPFGVKPEMALQTSRGRFTDYRLVEAVPDGVPGHWRAQFDLADAAGDDPVELRLQLTVAGKVATETWMFQYHPLKG